MATATRSMVGQQATMLDWTFSANVLLAMSVMVDAAADMMRGSVEKAHRTALKLVGAHALAKGRNNTNRDGGTVGFVVI